MVSLFNWQNVRADSANRMILCRRHQWLLPYYCYYRFDWLHVHMLVSVCSWEILSQIKVKYCVIPNWWHCVSALAESQPSTIGIFVRSYRKGFVRTARRCSHNTFRYVSNVWLERVVMANSPPPIHTHSQFSPDENRYILQIRPGQIIYIFGRNEHSASGNLWTNNVEQ